jgi:starvation-inducible outer membrane lipoprotein
MMMKKHIMIVAAIVALAVAGCQDKPKGTPSAAVPPGGMSSQQMPAATPGNSPHNAAMPPAQPAGVSHKGKVVATMNAAGYTYMQVDEKGQKIWAAAKETKLKVGDEVEFPDSPVMQNFTSKTLNRTFDKIFFLSTLRVNGK